MELRSSTSASSAEGLGRLTQLLFLDGISDSQACDCAEPAISLASIEPHGAQLSEYDAADPKPDLLLVFAFPIFQKF